MLSNSHFFTLINWWWFFSCSANNDNNKRFFSFLFLKEKGHFWPSIFEKKKAPLKVIKRQSIFKYDKPNYTYTCCNMSYFGLLLVVCEIEDYEKLENEQNHAKNVASGPKYMLTAYVDHSNEGWHMFF
jgi:hypothetical protein